MRPSTVLALTSGTLTLALSKCTTIDTITRTIGGVKYVIDYPSTNANKATDCILEKGMTGSKGVESMQESIIYCYPQLSGSLEWTGSFGDLTEKVLRRVQKEIGATVDGIWGPETGDLMLWYGTGYIGEYPVWGCAHNGL